MESVLLRLIENAIAAIVGPKFGAPPPPSSAEGAAEGDDTWDSIDVELDPTTQYPLIAITQRDSGEDWTRRCRRLMAQLPGIVAYTFVPKGPRKRIKAAHNRLDVAIDALIAPFAHALSASFMSALDEYAVMAKTTIAIRIQGIPSAVEFPFAATRGASQAQAGSIAILQSVVRARLPPEIAAQMK